MDTTRNHIVKLKSICRLCRSKIKVDRNYSHAKRADSYVNEIRKLFDYDFSQEFKSIHPELLCNTCRRKLDRCKYWKKLNNQPLAVFIEHSDDCEVCFSKKFISKHEYIVQPVTTDESNKLVPSALSKEHTPKELIFEELVNICKNNNFALIKVIHDKFVFAKSTINSEGYTATSMTLNINKDFTWDLFIFSRNITNKSSVHSQLPQTLSSENIDNFFTVLNSCCLCLGNNDFPTLIKTKIDKGAELFFKDKNNEEKATIENSFFDDVRSSLKTIRVKECDLLVIENFRCEPCKKYRKVLKAVLARGVERDEKDVSFSKYTTNANLSRQHLETKSANYAQEIKVLRHSKEVLLARIDAIAKEDSVPVVEDINDIVHEVFDKVEEFPFDTESPQYLLWEQQKKHAKLNKKTSMRWHPVMIRWCLSIYLKSPGTYEHLRGGGFLQLPHKTTLLKYTSFTEAGTGFNPDVIDKMLVDIGFVNMKDYEKNVSLLFDEMRIKSNLVYSRSSGKVVGFTELGDINKELDEFKRCFNEPKEAPLATHVMAFMARGLFKRFNYPIGYFACTGFNSDQLFPVVWEAVCLLESHGIHVRSFVCDGASPNRKFFRIHDLPNDLNMSDDGVTYWAWNRFARKKKIYFICDPPHLIKTIRNNLENSHGHNNTRQLVYNGKDISWQHLIRVYENDLGSHRFALGLRKLHKLTDQHINLNPGTRMRVYLAAQVLSSTVANAMRMEDNATYTATITLIEYMDKFFDCLNVTTSWKGNTILKDALKPYKDMDDWRFDWLKNTFLGFINGWKEECEAIAALPKDIKSRLCLAYQTIEGIRITVHSFVDLAKELLQMDGVEYFLSDKLNQDPLEEHFGKQRMRGGGNENPTLEEYGHNERKILVMKSDMIRVMRGNTRGRAGDGGSIDIHDERQLPRKKKKKEE